LRGWSHRLADAIYQYTITAIAVFTGSFDLPLGAVAAEN
jgi:hypothetical protein